MTSSQPLLPQPLTHGTRVREVDFLVVTESATFIAEVSEEEPLSEPWVTEYVPGLGHLYRPVGIRRVSVMCLQLKGQNWARSG